MGNPFIRDSSIAIGVATILATVFAMALADAVVKLGSSAMTLWQIYVLRSMIVAPALLWLAKGRLPQRGLGWIVLRSLALALMYLGIYAAIPLLDLSVIAASLYTGPLFIVALSAIFLRETISRWHWAAILTGFAGVLVMVRPATADFNGLALIPVSAGLLYAAAAVLTRAKCAEAPALSLALWLNVTLLAFGAAASLLVAQAGLGHDIDYPFLFGRWSPMTERDWRLIAVLALLMVGVSIGLAKAYQSPRPQVIAAFDYAYLIFAGVWDFVFFGRMPETQVLPGMALIAAAGVMVLHADAQASRRAET